MTEPIVEGQAKRRRLGVPLLPTNAFDPEEQVDPAGGSGRPRARRPDMKTLVHTGRMEAAREYPEPLLDALRRAPARVA